MNCKHQLIVNHIKGKIDELHSIALTVIHNEARAILRKHPNLNEFIMGMGSAFFTTKDGNDLDLEDRKYFKSIEDLFIEFDTMGINVKGNPMRFTANGPKITNW